MSKRQKKLTPEVMQKLTRVQETWTKLKVRFFQTFSR